MKDFGGRLRRLRESRGLSQRELAELIGIKVLQVNRYENGVNLPSAITLPALARIFELSVDQLLDLEQQPIQKPEIRHPVLLERFRRIEKEINNRRDLDTLVTLIDAFLARKEIQRIAASA